ncbi:SAG1386/EF1546 family surface-associated protein [Streptococcus panodentis]|uniref:LysM domain-containing protein n=1 Tax=Streptococcus panodentis TaxID=1581472 RepID=A0ABS5AZ47_9STRE|nr:MULTISPECIES: SAG1386/EF1546 family surface-associated protein [Streptococcus]KXT84049.1 hypothetical protein STRDD11_01151 [Streptococcus sp. DD11]MBP2621862.1 hypothetical protein [Streptococcus panodentis]
MEKEPWEEDVYDDGAEKLKRTKKFSAINADRLLTVLTIIFCVLVVAVICFLTYLSTGGSNKNAQMEGFYGTSAASSASSEAASSSQTAEQTDDTTASSEGTITVQAGEGEAAIAARAGISIAKLEQLNPSHMSTGSWYANPGDVVKIE